MSARTTRRVHWREGRTRYTAVATRQDGRSELQYVRATRVAQDAAPECQTDWDVTPTELPSWAARKLEVEQ